MMKLGQKAFTLVEMLVISPILVLVVIGIMSFLFNQYGQLTKLQGELDLQVEAQNILFGLQDELFYASQYRSTTNAGLTDTYSSNWSGASSANRLITSYPALTTDRRNESRQFVFFDEVGCDASVIEDNSVVYNNTVYFVSGTRLYKRTVTAPSTTATCGASFFKQTCPSGTSGCKADIELTSQLGSFTVTYYDTDNTIASAPDTAERVKVDIVLNGKAFGEDITASSSLTLRKGNE